MLIKEFINQKYFFNFNDSSNINGDELFLSLIKVLIKIAKNEFNNRNLKGI